MSKFLERLNEQDDGTVQYSASAKIGESQSTDDQEHTVDFSALVPPSVLDAPEECPVTGLTRDEVVTFFLKGYDLELRAQARQGSDYYEAKSETLSPEERERRKRERAKRMKERHQVGALAEEADMSPEEMEKFMRDQGLLD